MKYLLFVFAIVVLAFSCKKEDKTIYDNSTSYPSDRYSTYYFNGIIKDTSNNNSLINLIVGPGSSSCVYNMDTLTDSTYFFYYTYKSGKIPCGLKDLDVILLDTNRTLIYK